MTSAPPPEHDGDEEAWRRIVAGFDLPTEPVGRWPAAEDVDPPARARRDEALAMPRAERPEPGVEPAADVDPEPGPEPEPAEDDDEHYVPPPPRPLPVAHPLTFWAWIALVGGVALLLLPALLGDVLSDGWVVLAVLLIVSGAGTLVVRMRDSPPTDSGPDDGAVV